MANIERLLFTPLTIRHHVLRNRVVNTPHQTHMAEDGLVTKQQIAYYEARASGGVAMIVAGSWAAWRRTWSTPLDNLAAHPQAYEGQVALAEAVHKHGTLLVGQLHDSGRQGSSAWQRLPLLAPSAIADPIVGEIPKEMDEDDIEQMIEAYVESATSLCNAGWDGVEVFAAQGYALGQFLSPQMNRRSDRFGGDINKRLQFIEEIIFRIRQSVGKNPILGLRMNGSDLVDGGLGVEDACVIAAAIESTGAVDYLSVSAGSNENYPAWIADMTSPRTPFLKIATKIRDAVTMPILVATRVKSEDDAERVLSCGIDMVGMTRALIADPELPNKSKKGKSDEIRPCIGCNQGCLGSIIGGGVLRCTTNPYVGIEGEGLRHIVRPYKVIVIGGGPAGLQASVTLAECGYLVTVLERSVDYGGQLALAARITGYSEFGDLIKYLVKRADKLGVHLQSETEATLTELQKFDFDALILASGSLPIRTGYSSAFPSMDAIPGFQEDLVLTAEDILSSEVGSYHRSVIIDDDPHGQAISTARHLASLGIETHLVTRKLYAASWAGPAKIHGIYKDLGKLGVSVHSMTWVDRIGSDYVELHGVYDNQTWRLDDVDVVVVATGNRVNDRLLDDFKRVKEKRPIIRIGDCLAPRLLDHAIWDGYKVAESLGKVLKAYA